MKRLLLATAALAGIASVNQGLAQVGPGDQPATLRTPWLDQAPAQANPTAGAFLPGLPTATGSLPQIPNYQPQPDPNRDLFVTSDQAPWLICVTCYSGPQSPGVAREMVMELRERYKLPAYVFSKGDEERRAEFQRVKAIVEDYHKLCIEKHISPDPHMRVRTRHIENEYAILVGGYPDADAARRGLDKIRNLPEPQNKKLCAVALFPEVNNSDDNKPPATVPPVSPQHNLPDNKKSVEPKYLSPFKGAFVVHNPAIKQERPADWEKQDMAVLQKLNRGEKYSLLNCPPQKHFTLVVKQFLLRTETKTTSGNIFGKMLNWGHQSDLDVPAENAHNMAELLNKTTHLDAFVLHTKYASMVTVGAFDSLDDPTLRATQEMLKNQYKIPMPVPMAVPR